jgi:hypothetical protein
MATTCDCGSLRPDDKQMPQRDVTQVHNKQGLLGHTARAQGLKGDQVGPRRGPHAHTTGAQIGAMATIQGGQGSRQVWLLARSRALHRQHSNLPALLYLKVRGLERPMRSIMEHA